MAVQVADGLSTGALWALERPTVLIPALLALLFLSTRIYRVFFHPLARFPGPRLAAASHAWYSYAALSGKLQEHLADAHRKYGNVVRVSPNALSFSSVKAMEGIYVYSNKNDIFLKGTVYDGLALNSSTPNMRSLLTEKNPEKHADIRKYFGPCFSPTGLAEQEESITTLVDVFISKMYKYSSKPLEIGWWYHCLAFDITGKLSLGESFGSTKTEVMHFWVQHFLNHFKLALLVHVLNAYPAVLKALVKLVPSHIRRGTERNKAYAEKQVHHRLQKLDDGSKKDFFSILTDQINSVTEEQLVAHGASFVIAGSETTATSLTATTYWLASHDEQRARLQAELLETFQSDSDIKAKQLQDLPYLNAVIKESMRLFPPVALGGVRVSPGTTVDGVYVPKGVEVSSPFYAMGRSEDNFHDPHVFKPERWLDSTTTDTVRATQPFSYGQRNCIGRYLALMEMRIILAKLLINFDFELVKKDLDWIQACKCFIMWEKPPLEIQLKPMPPRA